MRRVLTVSLLVLLICLGLATAATAGAAENDADTTVIQIDIDEDGNAEWTTIYRVDLDEEDEREAFETLQYDIEEYPEEFEGTYEDRIQTLLDSTNVEREMEVSNATVTAEKHDVPHQHGVIEYQIEWKDFAQVNDDGTIEAGDVLHGLYLDEDTQLVISYPEDSEVNAEPAPDEVREDAVVWDGERQFLNDEPMVSISESDGTDEGDDMGLFPVFALIGGLILAAGAFAVYRFKSSNGDDATDTTGSEESSGEEPLLSNEERVVNTLEENGGRMKQKELRSALDWTDAKTSRVVSGLREEGTIDGFRLGRENVLELPESEDED